MKCPNCDTILCRIEYEGVPICTCPGCNGEFVDRRRLRLIRKRKVERFEQAEAARLEAGGAGSPKTRQRICPRCGNLMSRKNYHMTSVVVDYCKSCQGIWLDDQELEKIQVLSEKREAALAAGGSGGPTALEAAAIGARAAFKENRGESTADQGYVAVAPEKSVTVPRLWVRATIAGVLAALAFGLYSGFLYDLLPLVRLFDRSTLDSAADTLTPVLALLVLFFGLTFTRVTLQAGRGLKVSRFIAGFPWIRTYSRDEIACIGTDYDEPGMFGQSFLHWVVDVWALGYWALLYDREPRGKSYLYVVLKNGKRVCIYSGRNDSHIGELSDFLQSALGLRVKRL